MRTWPFIKVVVTMSFKSLVRKGLAPLMPSIDPDVYKNRLAGKTAAEIFTAIYEKKLWGGRLSLGFHSGNGSRDPKVVEPYIAAIRKLLTELNRPSVLDLGCGDFEVSRHLVDYANPIIACDIVAPVIEANRRKYPGIDFRIIDAIASDYRTICEAHEWGGIIQTNVLIFKS